jgi:phosphoribosylformylglycinamidine synthase subunit PurS
MRVQIFVRLKPGVLDVQGKAVEQGLLNLGMAGVANLRVGKLIELDVEAQDTQSMEKQVKEFCEKLLVNPVIENFEIRQLA